MDSSFWERIPPNWPLFVVGLGLCLANTYFSIRQYFRIKKMKKVMGEIVGYSKSNSSGGTTSWNTNYAPIVEYEFEGETYKYSTDYFTPWKRKGTVQLLIEPEKPNKRVLINGWFELWSGTIVLYFLGGLLVWATVAWFLGWKNIIEP